MYACMYVCMCICSKDWVIERASEAFSLVMKTHNFLRRKYVSSSRILAHAFQFRAQQAPPPLGYAHKQSRAYYPVFKSIKWLEGGLGMDR